MSEDTLFERTPLERLLALQKFLQAEEGHRVHLLTRTIDQHAKAELDGNAEGADKLGRKIPYWKKSVHECHERLEDVNALINECD